MGGGAAVCVVASQKKCWGFKRGAFCLCGFFVLLVALCILRLLYFLPTVQRVCRVRYVVFLFFFFFLMGCRHVRRKACTKQSDGEAGVNVVMVLQSMFHNQ